ncbi:SRPBCC family protein [Dyella soli]|uniref:Polyketide cyclase/dehydrase n=1 Tax=Dyella soli TaxID=522319 RepID=A0A4R0YKI6_9GAMM|nr:SRPBCC family protein [Dyella soli]TCI08978.1 polyketide cyclase/dehydrase [Dyella soli]
MWMHEESMETTARPERIWQLFADVPGWKAWNAGIEHIELHGPFAAGTSFTMQPPGMEPFTSTLTAVRENEGFTDETVVDGTRVVVEHRIEVLAPGRTRIVYRTRIDGVAADDIGPLVTGDFADVLRALRRQAELD